MQTSRADVAAPTQPAGLAAPALVAEPGQTRSSPAVHTLAKFAYAIVAVCVVLGAASTLLGLRAATSAPQQLVALCEGLAWVVLPYVGARSLEKLLG